MFKACGLAVHDLWFGGAYSTGRLVFTAFCGAFVFLSSIFTSVVQALMDSVFFKNISVLAGFSASSTGHITKKEFLNINNFNIGAL